MSKSGTPEAMAGPSREFLKAVLLELPVANSSLTISPSGQRRLRAALQDVGNNIEINDDEKERLVRREQILNKSAASISSAGSNQHQLSLSTIFNTSVSEMNNQIVQCIKLSAENKITSKNAFQLKMIDFLLYTLKKQDPSMTNLQLASASLDASAKIYGFRVDKVYSDLLKIIGNSKHNRDYQHSGDEDIVLRNLNNNENQQKRKQKKNRQRIISTAEALKDKVETYDPLSLIRCQIDTQTSDMLFQAGFPQHANQGVALNLYNDVILDSVPLTNDISVKVLICSVIDDFTSHRISPSYAAFKFLDWSSESEIVEQPSQIEDNDGNYRFDLDAPVPVDDVVDNDTVMGCEDAYEERCNRMVQNNQHVQNIVDFKNVIAKNPNANVTYEYSYLSKNIHWVGPPHWKIKLNKGISGNGVEKTCKQTATRKRKEIELSFSLESKEGRKNRFDQINRLIKLESKAKNQTWFEDKETLVQDVHYDSKRWCTFFNKPVEYIKIFVNQRNEETDANDSKDQFDCNNDDIDHFRGPDNTEYHFGNDNEEERLTQESNHIHTHETVAQTQAAFVGDSLVSVPKLADKVFIPYSQRAKKIDMHQLKKAMWKSLRTNAAETGNDNCNTKQEPESENNNNEILPKKFSKVYVELPKLLSKVNAHSLSPAIAFSSLLHLSNIKNLKISTKSDLSDLVIQSGNNNAVSE